MWWAIILCVIIILIGLLLLSPSSVYIPSWKPVITQVPDMSLNIYVPFYLPTNVGVDVIESEFNKFGTMTWINTEHTYALVNTTIQKFQDWIGEKYPLSIVNGFLGCYNGNMKLPYGLIALIDFWGLTDFSDFKTVTEWSSDLNIPNTPIGTPGTNIFRITDEAEVYRNLLPAETTAVGILCADSNSLPSSVCLEQLAESLGFEGNKFLSQIVSTTFNYSAGPGDDPVILLDTNFSTQLMNDMSGSEFELNLDLQSIFSVNPEAFVFVYYTNNSDPMIILQYCLVNQNLPKVWSSSLGLPVKFSSSIVTRVNQELNWLSDKGITTLQASGDQGMYSSSLSNNPDYLEQTFDAKTPDTNTGYFNGTSTLMVGGFARAQNATTHVSMALQPYDDSWNNLFFASGAGFSRGYHTEASYKTKVKRNYLYTHPSPSNFVELDYQGNMRPDLVSVGQATLANGDGTWTSSGGTSMATPFVASMMTLASKIKNASLVNLNQTLYSNPDVFIRPISNPNTFYNLPGFTSDQHLTWDPVQGLGVLNISQFMNLL